MLKRLQQMGMPFDRDKGVELLKEIYLYPRSRWSACRVRSARGTSRRSSSR